MHGMALRVVKPEILDHLPSDDPEAMRSRSDLRRINFLMGNERWIVRTIREFPAAAAKGIVELGAGDGMLSCKLARMFPEATVTACDLVAKPAGIDERVRWMQGDVFANDGPPAGGVLVANLFLHHFEGDSLVALGKLCARYEVVIFNEPDRAALPPVLGALMWPFINRVTRHDMHVSIDAGFSKGELLDLMGMDANVWQIQETSTWRGARRVLGCRT
jgi:hypothetical protein